MGWDGTSGEGVVGLCRGVDGSMWEHSSPRKPMSQGSGAGTAMSRWLPWGESESQAQSSWDGDSDAVCNTSPLRAGKASPRTARSPLQGPAGRLFVKQSVSLGLNLVLKLFRALFSFSCPGHHKACIQDFSGGPVVGNLPANTGDMGSLAGPGRSHMPHSDYAREPRLWRLCYSY